MRTLQPLQTNTGDKLEICCPIEHLVRSGKNLLQKTSIYTIISFRICAPPWVCAFCFKAPLAPAAHHPSGWCAFYFPSIRSVPCALRSPFSSCSPLSLLSACRIDPTPTIARPEAEPHISGLKTIEVDQATADSVRRHIGPYAQSNPYHEFENGSQLLLYLVSSGEFGQVEITLEDGQIYQADVLYAYSVMTSQRVLSVPVHIGLSLPDGSYTYFSESYASQAGEKTIWADVPRDTALADVERRLPRGRIFRLLAYGMVTPRGLDWEKCPSVSLYPPEICPIGKLVESLNPGQTQSFVLGLSDGFSENWLAVGWVFQEFDPDDLVAGAGVDVPLPDPAQP